MSSTGLDTSPYSDPLCSSQFRCHLHRELFTSRWCVWEVSIVRWIIWLCDRLTVWVAGLTRWMTVRCFGFIKPIDYYGTNQPDYQPANKPAVFSLCAQLWRMAWREKTNTKCKTHCCCGPSCAKQKIGGFFRHDDESAFRKSRKLYKRRTFVSGVRLEDCCRSSEILVDMVVFYRLENDAAWIPLW